MNANTHTSPDTFLSLSECLVKDDVGFTVTLLRESLHLYVLIESSLVFTSGVEYINNSATGLCSVFSEMNANHLKL